MRLTLDCTHNVVWYGISHLARIACEHRSKFGGKLIREALAECPKSKRKWLATRLRSAVKLYRPAKGGAS